MILTVPEYKLMINTMTLLSRLCEGNVIEINNGMVRCNGYYSRTIVEVNLTSIMSTNSFTMNLSKKNIGALKSLLNATSDIVVVPCAAGMLINDSYSKITLNCEEPSHRQNYIPQYALEERLLIDYTNPIITVNIDRTTRKFIKGFYDYLPYRYCILTTKDNIHYYIVDYREISNRETIFTTILNANRFSSVQNAFAVDSRYILPLPAEYKFTIYHSNRDNRWMYVIEKVLSTNPYIPFKMYGAATPISEERNLEYHHEI